MTRNVGTVDRSVRVFATLALVAIGVLSQAWQPVLLGVLVAVTAAAGFCPLYALYGLSTVGGVHRDCANGRCELPTPGR